MPRAYAVTSLSIQIYYGPFLHFVAVFTFCLCLHRPHSALDSVPHVRLDKVDEVIAMFERALETLVASLEYPVAVIDQRIAGDATNSYLANAPDDLTLAMSRHVLSPSRQTTASSTAAAAAAGSGVGAGVTGPDGVVSVSGAPTSTSGSHSVSSSSTNNTGNNNANNAVQAAQVAMATPKLSALIRLATVGVVPEASLSADLPTVTPGTPAASHTSSSSHSQSSNNVNVINANAANNAAIIAAAAAAGGAAVANAGSQPPSLQQQLSVVSNSSGSARGAHSPVTGFTRPLAAAAEAANAPRRVTMDYDSPARQRRSLNAGPASGAAAGPSAAGGVGGAGASSRSQPSALALQAQQQQQQQQQQLLQQQVQAQLEADRLAAAASAAAAAAASAAAAAAGSQSQPQSGPSVPPAVPAVGPPASQPILARSSVTQDYSSPRVTGRNLGTPRSSAPSASTGDAAAAAAAGAPMSRFAQQAAAQSAAAAAAASSGSTTAAATPTASAPAATAVTVPANDLIDAHTGAAANSSSASSSAAAAASTAASAANASGSAAAAAAIAAGGAGAASGAPQLTGQGRLPHELPPGSPAQRNAHSLLLRLAESETNGGSNSTAAGGSAGYVRSGLGLSSHSVAKPLNAGGGSYDNGAGLVGLANGNGSNGGNSNGAPGPAAIIGGHGTPKPSFLKRLDSPDVRGGELLRSRRKLAALLQKSYSYASFVKPEEMETVLGEYKKALEVLTEGCVKQSSMRG